MALLSFAKAGGGAGGTTGNIDTTGATIIVAVTVGDSGSSAPSDSQGNTWTTGASLVGGSFPTFHKSRIYWIANPTTSAAHNFTIAATNGAIVVAAFDGTVTPAVKLAEAGAQNLGASSSSGGSVSPTGTDLVVSSLGMEAAFTPTIGSSFTIADSQTYVGGTSYGCALAYKYSASAENPAWSLGASRDTTAINIVFQGTGGGGGGSIVPLVAHQYRQRRA